MTLKNLDKAPMPYFGGKSTIAEYVWTRLGAPKQYIEPFCGSAAVLLAAPSPASLEVIGDQNGYVANFWRCVKFQPDHTWAWADYPVSHIDQGARHRWLTEPERCRALEAQLSDPEWAGDPQIAGWWLWGQCSWIGSGWCDWFKVRQVPHTGDAGMGVQAIGQVPHTGDAGMGPAEWLRHLSARLERVRVIHGDWSRTLNHHYGATETAVFLDPPYKGFEAVYPGAARVASEVEEWARANPELRVALCGHIGDYDLPGWEIYQWSRGRLTYSGDKTTDLEAIWFSLGCERAPDPRQGALFGEEDR